MKIAVVSTGRSRCTLLAEYLFQLNPGLEHCQEFYVLASWEDKFDLAELTEELMSKENYIVKIMGMDLYPWHDPSVFKFEEYDQVHLIERHDFFDQCCSWKVARTERKFHLRSDNPKVTEKEYDVIRQNRYKLKIVNEIELYAKFVENYLEMKKYLVDNNIDFTMHTYESAKRFSDSQSLLRELNLNYSELIENYSAKEEVNRLFDKHFSYNEMRHDLNSFIKELNEVEGFRSMQSFASKMAAKWKK